MNLKALRLLLWLKVTLSWRMQRSSKLRVLSIVLFLVMLVPVSMLAYGLHWILGYASPSMREPIGRDALAVIYVMWIMAPLLGFQVNESYDLTKLFAYPLTYGQIFLGSVIGGLVDPPVLLAAPPLIALWLSSSTGVVALAVDALLIFVFLFQTIATSQAITILLIGFLRSRRFRDITIVVFPIVGLAYYVGQQALVRQFQFIRFTDLGIFDAPVWHVANYLPPGFAAAGIRAASNGDWGQALGAVAFLTLATALAMSIAAASLRRLFLGDVVAAETSPVKITQRPSSRELPGAAPRWIPAEVATLVRKELSYLRRDPQYKAVLVQGIYMVVVIAVPFLLPGYSRSPSLSGFAFLGDIRLFAVAAALVMATSPLIFNVFGAEGAAVTVLFSFPTSRRRILVAKNVAHSITLLTLNLIGLAIAAAATGRWSALPTVFFGVVIALPVLLAAGNLVSIRLPHRMLVRGQRWQRGGAASVGGDSSGCAYAFLYMLAMLVTGFAVAPIIAAVVLPSFSSSPLTWYLVAVPLACAYSAALYAILLGVAESWLLSREPEIAAAVMPPD